jgi:hypothetical protein
MTLIMLCVAFGTRTPVVLWLAAMFCDTILLTTYMIAKALHG